MSTTGHESEAINVQGLKASLQKLKTNHIDGKAGKSTTLAGYGITDAYTKSETYTKTEVNGLVDTPHQEYVTVDAYANLPATGSKDTIYRVSNYNGSTSQVDASVYSEYAWNGTQYIFLCVKSQIGEVFDISVYNNNAKYADLAAALGTDGEHVPQSLRKGGMSVKFVRSSDNNYVQWRYMSSSTAVADFTNVENWGFEALLFDSNLINDNSFSTGYYNCSGDSVVEYIYLDDRYKCARFELVKNTIYTLTIPATSSTAGRAYAITDLDGNVVSKADVGGSANELQILSDTGGFLYLNALVATSLTNISLLSKQSIGSLYDGVGQNQASIRKLKDETIPETLKSANEYSEECVSAEVYDKDDLSDGYYGLAGNIAPETITVHSSYKAIKIPVLAGFKYVLNTITTIHNSAKTYALTDSNRNILEVSDESGSRAKINKIFYPQVDGYLYVNVKSGDINSFNLTEYPIVKQLYNSLYHSVDGIKTSQSIEVTTLYDGYYITGSGTKADNGGYVITNFIPVVKGDTLTVNGRGSGSNVCGLAFSEEIIELGQVTPLVVSVDGVISGTALIKKDGYVICSYRKGYAFSLVKYSITKGIKQELDGIYVDERTLTTSVLTNQYYLSGGGNLVSRPGGDYNVINFIKVYKGDKVYVNGRGSGANVCVLGFKTTLSDGSITDFPVKPLINTVDGIGIGTVFIEEDGYITGSYRNAYSYTLKINECLIIGLSQRVELLESKVKEITPPELDKDNPLSTIITDGGAVGIFMTMAQIGDSLASGEMAYSNAVDESSIHYVDMYPQSWMSFMGRVTGRKVFNFSKGGASTKSFLAADSYYPDTQYVEQDFRNQNIHQCFEDNPCQAYFIALGHNDRNAVTRSAAYIAAETDEEKLAIARAAVGSPNDIAKDGIVYQTITDNDLDDILAIQTDTYYVRYAQVIAEIKKIQKYAKIFPVCMIAGHNPNNPWELEGWNGAIRYMAEIFTDIYIIDMGKWGTRPSWHYTQGHGNAMGYQALANEYMAYADWIIRNNREYFMYTSFIGDTSLQDIAIKESSRGSVGSSFD